MWLVPELCFTGVDTLLETGAATVPLFGNDTKITLRRDGETIEITANIMAPARFPATPLLRARWLRPGCACSR